MNETRAEAEASFFKARRQADFTVIVRALYVQNAKARTHGHCQYRVMEDGKCLKCGLGHLIPDMLYEPWMDDYRTQVRKVLEVIGREDDLCFYANAQSRLHDDVDDMNFREALLNAAREFAEDNDLTVPSVKDLT